MKNPFKYGEAVLGEHFADREKELQELVRDLSDCERIFLISPRRYGKTSLIMNALEILKSKEIYTVYIDLYKATSLHKLLEIYVREITNAVETKFEKMLDFLKKTLPGLRPRVTVDPDGTTSIGIEYTNSHEDTFRLLEAIVHAGSKEILSDDAVKKYHLESIAAVQAILKDLMDKQILDRENDVYWFTDVFFKEWIRRKI